MVIVTSPPVYFPHKSSSNRWCVAGKPLYVIVLTLSTIVPSAASFYVPNLPDLHQNKDHPLHIFAGHIESDPNGLSLPTNLSAHLFFVLVKARRTADKERVMFWFNVRIVLTIYEIS